MKKDRLTPGIILVLIGLAVLASNFGYLHFHWTNFVYLWPLFLVIGGVNLLLANNYAPWARATKIIVLVGCLGILFFGDFGHRYRFFPHIFINGHSHNNDGDNDGIDIGDDDDDSDSTSTGLVKVDGNSYYHTPFTNDIRIAKLNLNGGATTYNLSDTTNQLFAADVKEFYGHYSLTNHTQDSVSNITFDMKGDHKAHFSWHGNNKSNKATLKLNVLPVWDMDITAGATDLNFDLSKFKIRNFNLHGGAASFDVKLGQPVAGSSNIDVSSGVSDITISIPKDAACSIETSTGLSSNSFDGFNKTEDNHYETPGYANAKNKFAIKISGGLSDFKVKRY
ncbi:LiaI-LiaF-like domain-containing protein [Mucilaginibacter sp. KACC 22063]|uniref:LiaI-LiaF-like domain-containing protein n=1 Tax=Mucilaginibacter sp. KACC 22063 TaxID=3025666 RepID=UPI002366009E|nr:DUF5668 domain-containing protein [Mucilaginibacter sp. KACC 22063]WDF54566.1 DUF5668 domain-containing protein [Mucilaginibacter sp. KACC 22063]